MPLTDAASVAGEHFDLVVVGSGFGSTFFVDKLIRKRKLRVLMLEWGRHHPHAWQVETGRNSDIHHPDTYASDSEKPWNYTVGLGGGMNCWFGQTPRFHPNDFRTASLYGVGDDWPIGYADLEPYYAEAEDVMSVSGDPDMAAIMPRSTPFPQPPHRLSGPDRVMKAARPHEHFAMPTARARVSTASRPNCCASMRCQICPVDAKFSANNGFSDLYFNSELSLVLDAPVSRFESDANTVQAAVFESGGREHRVTADLFVLGANAIQSPAILLRSGMGSPLTGVGLHESLGVFVEAYLDGVDGFDGSTITTGLNYGLYDGDFRSDYGGALVYFENRWTHGLRPERNRWRQLIPMMIVTEDLLLDGNRVTVDGRGKASVAFVGASEYARRGQREAFAKLDRLLAPLPVEAIHFRSERRTESHLQGTLRMGSDPARSVVDPQMIHHRWRNLLCVGTSVFASCSCANPSLTAAALSLRAADAIV